MLAKLLVRKSGLTREYKVNKIIALAALLELSCNEPPSMDYTVYLDGFTTDQQQSALNAVGDWTTEIPFLSLNVVIGSCSGIHNHEICMHQSSDPKMFCFGGTCGWFGYTRTKVGDSSLGDTTGKGGRDGGEVWINIPAVEQDIPTYPLALQTTIAHEMGHAMGLKHHYTKCLMNPYIQYGSPTITQDDIAQFFYVREIP